ncbi:MAG: DNA polymerase/3'-5' exonuclease PolX, partial [Desulfobacterales bacterium]
LIERFVSWGEVREVRACGETRASVVLRSGLQVDLRRVESPCFGAALQYFTGSQAHNIALRQIARRRGLKVNEYGVFAAERRIAGRTEASVYRALGLPLIPPELREDQGEIEAAREGRLPALVSAADLRGDLHAHTTATDGTASLEEMAEAARRRGFEYLAITDHSRRLRVAGGLDERRLLEQVETIERLNERWKDFALLKGIEVEILEDGSLDLPDEVLGRLDLVIGAVHSGFRLSRERQTARILRAMDRRCFTILAHPTGRLLPDRRPYGLDLAAVIAKAAERGCFLELNAHPRRLDLGDTACREARAAGVRVAVNSDAHAPAEFAHLEYGIGQARRGWLEKKDVLNTLPLAELLPLLRRTMAR